MNIVLPLVALILSAAPPVAPVRKGAAPVPAPVPASKDKEVKQITLTPKGANRVYVVRTAIGYPAVVEFPERFAAPPACGDCGKEGLFLIDVFDGQKYFTIKPRLYPGVQPDGTDIPAHEFVTSVTVRLISGLTLTLQIELSERDRADARTVFSLPEREGEREFVQQQIQKAKQELDAEFVGRVEVATRQSFLDAFAQPHECVSSRERSRRDDMVIEARELCRFGNSVFLVIQLENRGRTLFSVGDISVSHRVEKDAIPVEELARRVLKDELEFGSVTTVVLGFKADGTDSKSDGFEVSVFEKGGRNRELVLSDLGF